jgi:F-type H+-transporting ATPase subunit delta
MANIARNRSLASRFARALFEVALAEGDPRQIECDLVNFVALFEQHPALPRALWNPAVPVARKQAVLAEITALGRYPAPLEKLLKLMAERDQLALLPHLLESYQRRLMDHYGIVQAHVTTATPLADHRLQAIAAALRQATGKEVIMTSAVDPALIGGVVAKVDSTVYDGSVMRQLERLRERIVETGWPTAAGASNI